LQPALSAKNIPGGRPQVLNVHQFKHIDRHPDQGAVDSSPESISDTEIWVNWNGELDSPNVSEDNWEAHNELDIELDNGSEDPKTLEQRIVSATPDVQGLIRSI